MSRKQKADDSENWSKNWSNMAGRNYPEARLTAQGEIVSMDGASPLPNFTGLVYGLFAGNPYVMWRWDDGQWDIINQGSTVVVAELDRFIKENAE